MRIAAKISHNKDEQGLARDLLLFAWVLSAVESRVLKTHVYSNTNHSHQGLAMD